MANAKYSREQKEVAKELLCNADVPRDALPYTREFDHLYRQYKSMGLPRVDKHTFWQLLCCAGKIRGGIGLKKTPGRRKLLKVRRTPDLTQDDAFELLRLCPESIGSRDRLPYTTAFDDMYRKFMEHTGRRLSRNEFWRVLSRLAKRSRKPEPVGYAPSDSIIPRGLELLLFTMNPWWKGEPMPRVPAFRRSIYSTLYDKVTKGTMPIVAVRGPRQAGKSTLQLQMIDDVLIRKRLVGPDRILRIQFDELPSLGRVEEPILTVVDWYQKKILGRSINACARENHPVYIFLDEIQNLSAWDAQLKAFVDHTDCRVYITGSSALRIQRGRDSLAGRIDQRDLGLLSLPEIAGFRKHGNLAPFDPHLDFSRWLDISFWKELSHYDGGLPLIIESVFQSFSEFGGYPYCHNKEDRSWADVRTYLIESVVERTIQYDLRVGGVRRDAKILREVFKLAARYTGQTPKMQTLAAELSNVLEGPIKPSEVSSYLDFIDNSLLLKLVPPLEARIRRQSAQQKICLCDHAIRAAWLQEKVPLVTPSDCARENHDWGTVGHIVEGIVGYFLSRLSGVGLSHLPDRHNEPEVDFIMVIGDSRIPIEVKYRPNAMRDRFTNGLKAFMAKPLNNAPFGILISKDECGGTDSIVAVPAKQLLLLQ